MFGAPLLTVGSEGCVDVREGFEVLGEEGGGGDVGDSSEFFACAVWGNGE